MTRAAAIPPHILLYVVHYVTHQAEMDFITLANRENRH
jgi:hypothetical protein